MQLTDTIHNIEVTYEPGHEKMCLIPYANNKGADQSAKSKISRL